MKISLSAPPQLIPQDELSMGYVERYRRMAENYLRHGKPTAIKMISHVAELFHYRKGNSSGVWFIRNKNKIAYIYGYRAIALAGAQHATEAIAYLFDPELRGVTREVFFDHLLPDRKFVVTDSIYTPDGYRWFTAQYAHAFRAGYPVFAIRLKPETVTRLKTFDEFQALFPEYWGADEENQNFRFAISLGE